MRPGVAKSKRLMCTACIVYCQEVADHERMKAVWAFFDQEGNLCAPMDHVFSDVRPAEEQYLASAKSILTASKTMVWNAIESISCLTKIAMEALVTQESHNGIWKSDNRAKAMIQCFVNKMIENI